MTMSLGRWTRRLAWLAGACMSSLAMAQTPPVAPPSVWTSVLPGGGNTLSCADCHSTPPNVTDSTGSGSVTYGLGEAWMGSASAMQGRVNAVRASAQAMANFADLPSGDTRIADLYQYLTQLRDGALDNAAPTPTVADTVAGSTASGVPFNVTVYNYRKTVLAFGFAVQGGTGNGFTFSDQPVAGQPGTCASHQVPASTGAASTCTMAVTVTFTAPQLAAPQTQLTFTDNLVVTLTPAVTITNTVQPTAIALSAKAFVPEPSVTPPSIPAFPPTLVGTTSPTTRTITITNSRTHDISYAGTLVPSSTAPTVTAAGEFAVASESCPGRVVTAGHACILVIQFTPLAPAGTGGRAAQLQLAFTPTGGDATPAAQNVDLSGTASPPGPTFAITNDLTSLTFTASVGSSATASAIVSNTGGTGFTINGFTFSGVDAADFALDATNTCAVGFAVLPTTPCNLVIRFTPSAGTTGTATVAIAHGAPLSPRMITLVGTTLGHLDFSQSALAFSSTVIGASSAPQSILVSHSAGGNPITLGTIAISGAAAGDYQRSGTCNAGVQLSTGQTCTIDIVFKPTAAGARDATPGLTLQSNGTNPSVAFALTGVGANAPAPVASLSPLNLPFGTVTVGGLYAPRPVTLTNTGNAPLTSIVISVAGAGFANVTPAGATACGATLSAGASCIVQVAYAPLAAGPGSGSLSVASNASGSPQTVALTGTGTTSGVPVLVWSPVVTQLDLGTVSSGSISTVQSVMLLNQGPGGVELQVLNAIGRDGSSFVVSAGTCPTSTPLFESMSCRLDVSFAPSTAGSKTATVQVVSNGTLPPALTLVGTGLGGAGPSLVIAPSALAFPDTRVGARSTPIDVFVSSSGTGVINVASFAVTGPYAVQAKTCPAVPFVLRAGSECTMTLIFKPAAEGTNGGTLHVTSDVTTLDVALSGNAEHQADVSSGGCSIASGDSLVDPALWALVALAAAALAYRRRARAADRTAGPDR